MQLRLPCRILRSEVDVIMSPTIEAVEKENVSPKLDKLSLKDKVQYFTSAVLHSIENFRYIK